MVKAFLFFVISWLAGFGYKRLLVLPVFLLTLTTHRKKLKHEFFSSSSFLGKQNEKNERERMKNMRIYFTLMSRVCSCSCHWKKVTRRKMTRLKKRRRMLLWKWLLCSKQPFWWFWRQWWYHHIQSTPKGHF